MSRTCVVIPVYHVEPFIHRCVDSLREQTHADFEMLLVDDGTPDRAGEAGDAYAELDTCIYAVHQGNGGLSAARNTGIDLCVDDSSDGWLGFVDSDDWVHPRYLESLVEALTKTNAQIAVCDYAMTNGEALKVDEFRLDAKLLTPRKYYCGSAVPATVAWGKLYPKRLFESLRYPVGKWHEDEFVTYRLLFSCRRIASVAEPLYAYYQNPKGITRSVPWRKLLVDKMDALVEQVEFFSRIRCTTAEMQRLMIFVDKLRQAEDFPSGFSAEEQQHVLEHRSRLLSHYPHVLAVSVFLKRHKHHKAAFPFIYFLYKQYVRFYCCWMPWRICNSARYSLL